MTRFLDVRIRSQRVEVRIDDLIAEIITIIGFCTMIAIGFDTKVYVYKFVDFSVVISPQVNKS